MKKYGAIYALVLAVVSGLLAVYLANVWLSGKPEDAPLVVRDSAQLTQVVIASRDSEVGMILNEDNLTLTEWPRNNVPQGTFASIDEVQGRVTLSRLKTGQPIISDQLAAAGSGAGLVAAIDKGHRAMAIKVDEVIGVGGFILPNSYVDVIGIDEKSGAEPTARTLLERVEILAIAQETYNEDGKPKIVKTVTLKVDPQQAKKLALQTHRGRVQLTLRNPLEDKTSGAKPKPAVVQTAKKGVPVLSPQIKTPKARSHEVEVIRKSKSSVLEFENVESENRI